VHRRQRRRFIALALGTILLGLLVHLGGTALPPRVRDVLGDALWASMIFWWMSALSPNWALVGRAAAAMAVCAAVECSQLVHTGSLDALRATRLGHLVLGSNFDVRDLVSYAVGIFVAAMLSQLGGRRTA
jgi:Protein of unknown function (DUF2809)